MSNLEPTTKDGRNVDADLGMLRGEAASVEVERPIEAYPLKQHEQRELPIAFATAPSPTYYELPAIKDPVWIPTIPLYFYVGGATGCALAIGAGVQLLDDRRDGLLRACRWVGVVGATASAALLISDLGRPSRFLHMLRVFRPTSPMSVGSWILAATGATSAVALLAELPGVLGRVGRGATILAGALGLPLTGYTGVLIANTAVPVWQHARRALPAIFLGSGLASAGALLELLPARWVGERDRTLVRRIGNVGKVLELAIGFGVEHEAERVPRAATPLKSGASGALWRAAKVLTATSLAVSLVPGASRRTRTAAALIGTAGAFALRFGLFFAGKRSARDPRATFEAQRAGFGAAEMERG